MKTQEIITTEKKAAASKSLEYIQNGMTIGLGTGSTIKFLVKMLADKINNGFEFTAVSTSTQTTKLANSLGVEIKSLDEVEKIDLTIDGADEVDQNLNGIKGGGGALLKEKIVASSSDRNIWIVDSTKYVEQLGKFPLPVEIVKFGAKNLFKKLQLERFNPEFRMSDGEKIITDEGHYILDLHLTGIENVNTLNSSLLSISGIVETGLFINICDTLIIGGTIECKVINKKKPES